MVNPVDPTKLSPNVLAEYLAAIEAHPFAALLVAMTIVGCSWAWRRIGHSPKH
jgi:hypothetical protein